MVISVKKRREHPDTMLGMVVPILVTTFVLVVLVTVGGTQTASDDVYLESRRQIMKLEQSMRLGAQQTLDDKEAFLNRKLMSWKRADINDSLWRGTPFLPELHFFQARPLYDHSPVFQFIRHLPKGGNLHVHFGATANLQWLVSNVTYRPHCYVCRRAHQGNPFFHFFLHPPPFQPECPWRLVADDRREYTSPQQYDTDVRGAPPTELPICRHWLSRGASVSARTAPKYTYHHVSPATTFMIFPIRLERNLSVVVEDPDTAYPTIHAVWQRFELYFIGILPVIGYRPVFTSYLWQTLQEALDDGVQYMELRLTVELYDLEGTYSDEETIEILQEVVYKFREQHQDFIGVKVIIASIKDKTVEQQQEALLRTVRLRQKYPDVVLGFDLIQHEDTAPSLLQLLNVLRHPATQPPHPPLPFFFHAGETAWTELTDLNLLDAVLLNTTRIGHAYALLRHPWVCDQVKEKGIAIEISPLSNQILKLVSDLRNHPGSVLLARDFPVVIASDDPAVWGATPLSHDFYVTFMAVASTQDDLRVLKQLALNSIQYSGLQGEEKTQALRKWRRAYGQFVDKMYHKYMQEEIQTDSAQPGHIDGP